MIEAMDDEIAARLISYGVPMPTMRIDLAKFPVLKALRASGSLLEFTGVENPRQLESADGLVTLPVGEARVGGFAAYGETIDLSAQKTVGTSASRFVWTVGSDTIAHTENRLTITDDLPANYQVAGLVTNPLFPGWTVQYGAWIYTRDGDANLDKSVNVQDVTATVSYVLKDKDNMISNFGFAEADVNYNNNVEIADVIGIANIIRNEPVTKASALRSEAEAPVQMELDADNFLTMNSQVPVAGIYLELVGAIDEIPLLGDAAKFMQASSLNGDTLRVINLLMDSVRFLPGKSRISRLRPGDAPGGLLLRREGQQPEVRWRRDRNLQCPDRGDQPLGGRLQLSEPVPWQHDLLLSTGGTRPDGYDPCILRERCVDCGTERFARRGRREPLYGCPSFTGGRLLLPLDGEDRPWCEGK